MKYHVNAGRFPAALVLALLAATAAAQHHEHRMVTPAELKWSDVPSLPPGARLAVIEGPMNQATPFTVRLKFPDNYVIPPHWHPAVERVTVLSGTFHMGVGEKFDRSKARALPAGGLAIMQPGTPHFVWTRGETVVQLHGTGPWGITYLNPGEDPRKQ
jgi:quercetin dioxygenase-like cupin family protein